MKFTCRKTLLIILFFVICCFIISLILGFVVFPNMLYSKAEKMAILEVKTDQYDEFVQPSTSYLKIYLFNILNANEVLNSAAKPNITQIGPFVYRHYKHKSVMYTDCVEDTVTYTQTGTFDFDARLSFPLTEDYEVTTLNLPMMHMYELAETFGGVVAFDQCAGTAFPGKESLFFKVKAKEILFEGFNFCKPQSDASCSQVNGRICSMIPPNRYTVALEDGSFMFSYYKYYKQKFEYGKYAVKRGVNDVKTLGEIVRWNDMNHTEYWGAETVCHEIKGSDSTLYPPHVTKNRSFFIFSTDICRYLELKYENDVTYQDIYGYKFAPNPLSFHSMQENIEDDCFCVEQTINKNGDKNCFLDGVINLQTCIGIPLLLSFPHFLWADDKYTSAIDGLSPEKESHMSQLILEPNTGIPLKNTKTTQFNYHIRSMLASEVIVNLTNTILPLLWTEEDLTPNEAYLRLLRQKYLGQVKLFEALKWSLIAVLGAVLLIFVITLGYKNYDKINR